MFAAKWRSSYMLKCTKKHRNCMVHTFDTHLFYDEMTEVDCSQF